MRECGVLVPEGGLQALVPDQAAVPLVPTRCRCVSHLGPINLVFLVGPWPWQLLPRDSAQSWFRHHLTSGRRTRPTGQP